MYLAQINVARMLGPIDSEVMKPFVDLLDEVNAVAESSRGFVWREKAPAGDPSLKIDNDPFLIINFSVWESPETLEAFVYHGLHRSVLMRRKEWFELPRSAHFAMWWIEPGSTPTLQDAAERLEHLRRHGESDYAFTFRHLKRV